MSIEMYKKWKPFFQVLITAGVTVLFLYIFMTAFGLTIANGLAFGIYAFFIFLSGLAKVIES